MDTAGRTWLSKIWARSSGWNADMSALEPQLATEWSSNEDSTVWTFKLREGVLWHDGETFDADDVVFSLNLALNPDAATNFPGFSSLSRESVASITAVDPYTVEIVLNSPNPRLPFFMIFAWVLPEHALKDLNPADYQTTDWFFTNPIGTGPFMHDEYVADQFWALVPNPNYFRGAPSWIASSTVTSPMRRPRCSPSKAVRSTSPTSAATWPCACRKKARIRSMTARRASPTTSSSTCATRSSRTCACGRRSCTPSTARRLRKPC
ncbi:MAG: hypothetical protein HND48_15775 [Chloroflexi bacterium]|nr:hypothetical protein [Chloroflexota bacterium]